MIRAGNRSAHEPVESYGQTCDVLRAMLGGREEVDGGPHLAKGLLHDADVGLARQARDHEVDVLAGGHLGVAHHVPSSTPHECAGHRVGEIADVRHGRPPGAVVEAHLGEGEVVVVEEQQIGLLCPRELWDLRARADDVELDALASHEAGVGEVVEPQGHAV